MEVQFTPIDHRNPAQRAADAAADREYGQRRNEAIRKATEHDAWTANFDAEQIDRRKKAEKNFTQGMADDADEFSGNSLRKVGTRLQQLRVAPTQDAAAKQRQLVSAYRRHTEWKAFGSEVRDALRVTAPDVYRSGGRHSYMTDLYLAQNDDFVDGSSEARARLKQYGRQVGLDGLIPGTPTSHFAMSPARIWNSEPRVLNSSGAMTSGTSSGGAFVTPVYLTDEYALWRSYVPSVADACTNLDLPDYGLKVEVPANQSGITVNSQSAEGNSVLESGFTGELITANVETYSAAVEVSQQLIDRLRL